MRLDCFLVLGWGSLDGFAVGSSFSATLGPSGHLFGLIELFGSWTKSVPLMEDRLESPVRSSKLSLFINDNEPVLVMYWNSSNEVKLRLFSKTTLPFILLND